jgi:purine-binding chemotaxis protein CheW
LVEQRVERQIVVLELGGAEYGFSADKVQEIVRLVEITPVPESPKFIKGVIDYRGDIAVVVDLLARLNMGQAGTTLATQIVIVEAGKHLVGLVVDKVMDVISVLDAGIMTAATDDALPDDLITGAYEDGERLLVLLDLDKILDFNGHDYLTKTKKKAKGK